MTDDTQYGRRTQCTKPSTKALDRYSHLKVVSNITPRISSKHLASICSALLISSSFAVEDTSSGPYVNRELAVLLGPCSEFTQDVKPVFDKREGKISIEKDVHNGMLGLLAANGFIHGRLTKKGTIDNYYPASFDSVAYEGCKLTPTTSVMRTLDYVVDGGVPTSEMMRKRNIDFDALLVDQFFYDEKNKITSAIDAKCSDFSMSSIGFALIASSKASGGSLPPGMEYAELKSLSDKFHYYLSYAVGFLAGLNVEMNEEGGLFFSQSSKYGYPALNQEQFTLLYQNMALACSENLDRKISEVIIWVGQNKIPYKK